MSTVEVDGLYRQTPVETFMESYAGFFGFVVSADIHDVNFENVNFELDFNKIRDDGSDLGLYYFNNGATNTNDKGQISQILHAGVLCGRTVRKMPNSTLPADTLCSNIYNITATNVSGKIVCAQISFGGIIGTDNSANIEEEYLRQNLHVTGLDITTQFTGVGTGNSNVHFGGIVGDVLEESNLVYRNCSSSGKVAVLGYADASLVGQQIKGLKGSESKNKTYVKYGNAPSSIPEAGSRSLDLNGLGITNHATNNYGAFCVGGVLGRSYRVGMGAAQFSEGLMFDSCSSDLNIIIYNYFNVKKKKGIEFLIKGIQFYIAHGTEADPNLPSEVPNSRETSGLCGFDDSTVNRRLIEINCQDSCTYDIHKNNNEVYSPAI